MRIADLALISTLTAAPVACGDAGGDASAGSSTGTSSTTADTTVEPTTGEPGLQRCEPTCEADADCTLGGDDIGFVCVDGVCGLPPCTDDDACVALLSGWSTGCGAQAECAADEVCVEIAADDGRCAVAPGPMFACADFGLEEVLRPTIEGDANATVCGSPDAACVAGACAAPCKSDAACPAFLGAPHCDRATGQCTCSSDAECLATMQPGLVACIAGRCGCTGDADCVGGTNVDTCYAGACGCAGAASCTDPVFDGATQVCRP